MRNIHPDLLDCLRRPNPYTELVTEISAPDTSDVLRRPDQFTGAKLLSQTPANSLATSSRGPMQIASASANIATFAGVGGSGDPFYLNREDASRRLKGVGWELDKAFVRAVLRTVTVKIYRAFLAPSGVDFELQVFRVTRTPGLKYKPNQTTGTPWNEYTFTPLLSPAAVIKWASIAWVGNDATLAFDLTNHGLVVDNTPEQAVSPDQVGELPRYYIVVRPVNMSKATDRFGWYVDGATAQTVAGVGTFRRTYWARNSDQEQWSEDIKPGTPNVTVAVEQFQASSEAVYSLDLTRAPAAGTAGRVMFERLLPPGTTASLSISTAGSGGPWTAVKHGDVVGVSQQTYHLKLTLTADAALRSSPGVTAIGVEFRRTYDVSVESIVELPTREISLPWLEASIAEAKLKVLRTGIRDYLDVASTIGATESHAKLEVDIYLASRHPAITRDKWLRLERMLVTNRTPSPNAEEFSLLSYASKLKKKIPEKKETISSVHTVQAGSTAAAVLIGSDLPGASDTGNEYDNKRYYVRVQKSAVVDIPPGHVQEIAGNTGKRQLDFSPALPGVLAAGDVLEVHSGVYNTATVTWQDTDFADIWWQLLTTYIGIPPERIGHGSLPRGGRPPTVADRAPGDAAAQAKLKGTFSFKEQESGDEPLDQVSFHLGGATVEIDGQICFAQIYPLRGPTGVVTVPLPPVSRVFDLRDYSGLAAAPGLEKRATVLSAQYGKNAAAANPDAYPEKTTVVIDNDAFAWLARTDLEDLGTTELPDKIRRWIYNSSDTGLQLATDEAGMVVRATSTGLRSWPFTVGDAQPELTIGDVVVLLTDQYTDYDPASVTALRGWLAVRGVVVRAGGMGRQLSIFVQGLADNVTAVKGGQTGDISSLGDAPEKPSVTVAFNAAGQPTLNLDGRDLTASLKVDVDKVATPTDAEVEATAAIAGAGASVSILSPTWAPGEILYGKAFAYAGAAGSGQRSEATVFAIPREGTGKAAAPRVFIIPVLGSRSQTSETLRVGGEVNSGGAEPLQYRYRIDDGAWSAYAALGVSGSTVDLVVAKAKFYDKVFQAQLRDAGLVESDIATWTVIGEYEGTAPGTGRLKPTIPMDTTGWLPFGRGGDTAADVVELSTHKFTHGGMLDASRNVVNVYRSAVNEPVGNLFKRGSDTAADIVATAARTFIEPNFVDASLRPTSVYRGIINESVANLFKRGSDTASDIVEVVGRNFIDGGMIDASRRVVNVYRTAVAEPVANLFKRGSDTAADVLTTSARSYVDPALVDPSFRVTSVYRSGVNEPVNNLLKAGDSIPPSSLSAGYVDVQLTYRAWQHFARGFAVSDAVGQSLNAGVMTEASANILNIGGNDDLSNRFGGTYTAAQQGGFLRVDFRTGQPLFAFYGRAAGSTGGVALLAQINATGALAVTGAVSSESSFAIKDAGVQKALFVKHKDVTGSGTNLSPVIFAETGLSFYVMTGGSATPRLTISATGVVTLSSMLSVSSTLTATHVTASTTGYFAFDSRGFLRATSDGNFALRNNVDTANGTLSLSYLYANDGAAANPSIRFWNAASGLYLISSVSGNFGVSVNGVARADFTSTGGTLYGAWTMTGALSFPGSGAGQQRISMGSVMVVDRDTTSGLLTLTNNAGGIDIGNSGGTQRLLGVWKCDNAFYAQTYVVQDGTANIGLFLKYKSWAGGADNTPTFAAETGYGFYWCVNGSVTKVMTLGTNGALATTGNMTAPDFILS